MYMFFNRTADLSNGLIDNFVTLGTFLNWTTISKRMTVQLLISSEENNVCKLQV